MRDADTNKVRKEKIKRPFVFFEIWTTPLLMLSIPFIITGCTDQPSLTAAQFSKEKPNLSIAATTVRKISPVDGFDFPVGKPDAKKYYNAQGFQANGHLGEDWNGVGGGNSDKGDTVFAVASGYVNVAEDHGEGWGNVIRIYHNIGSREKPQIIESLYAHLDKMLVKPDQIIIRGQQIGTIGDANGAYWAHLHLEIRWKPDMEVGGGYSTDTTGFLVPTKFIRSHRNIGNN